MKKILKYELLTVKISSLKILPYHVRKDFKRSDLLNLRRSIVTHGLVSPIIVDRELRVIDGARRLKAMKSAGFRKVRVVKIDIDEKDILLYQLISNLQRKELNPIEKAKGIKSLMEKFNLTQHGVARLLSISQPSVARYLKLLELPEEVQEKIKAGYMKPFSMERKERVKSEEDQVRGICRRLQSIISMVSGSSYSRESYEKIKRVVENLLSLIEELLHEA